MKINFKGEFIMSEVKNSEVKKTTQAELEKVVKEEVAMLIPKGGGTDWQTETELLPSLDAPIEAGKQKILL